MTQKFEAYEDRVYLTPQKTETGISMGFHVLTVEEFVADPCAVAEKIAKILTEHWRD